MDMERPETPPPPLSSHAPSPQGATLERSARGGEEFNHFLLLLRFNDPIHFVFFKGAVYVRVSEFSHTGRDIFLRTGFVLSWKTWKRLIEFFYVYF